MCCGKTRAATKITCYEVVKNPGLVSDEHNGRGSGVQVFY